MSRLKFLSKYNMKSRFSALTTNTFIRDPVSGMHGLFIRSGIKAIIIKLKMSQNAY